MKRWLWICAGALALVVAAAILILPSLLNVERYRPAIASALQAASGRAVTLGPMKLRLLPLPTLAAEGLTIAEDPRFGSEPFLRTEQLEIRVRLLPLFRRQVSIVALSIERPELRVRRDRQGRWSVLSLGSPPDGARGSGSAPASARPPAEGAAGSAGASGGGAGLTISADLIRLERGKLTFVDEALQPGRTVTAEVHEVSCTIRDLSFIAPVGIDLSFDLEGVGRMALAGKVGPLSAEGGGTLPLDLSFGLARNAASIGGKLTGVHERPGIDLRLASKEIALREIAPLLRLLGPLLPAGLAPKGKIAVDVALRGPLDEPAKLSIEGTASVADLELSDPSLTAPITGIRGTLALHGDRAEIGDFGAALGKSSVRGACTVTRFEKPVLDVRLESPLLDLDELLTFLPAASSASAAAASRAPAVPAAPDAARSGSPPAQARSAAAAAPASALDEVTIRGDLSIAKAKVMNLALSQAKAKLDLERGVARLSGVSVDLYRGHMTGEVVAQVTQSGPPFSLAARLADVDFNALATDFSKDLAGLLYGTLAASLDVRGRGLDTPALERDLSGHGSLALRDGKLTSVSILGTVSKGLQAVGGRGIGENETPFQSLAGTFEIANGRAVTSDLTLDSADIRLTAKGSIGLDLSLDLGVAAIFSPEVSGNMVAKTATLKYLEDSSGRLTLGLKARGSLSSPSLGIDREMLDRAAKAAVKDKALEKGKSLLQKLFERKKG